MSKKPPKSLSQDKQPSLQPQQSSASKQIRAFLQNLDQLISSKPWLFFIPILLVGLYLRFYNIESVVSFVWDQGRDAWVVRDIVQGKFSMVGPRTGVGDFHLGPIYYYLLAPFFLFTNLDPMASNYFNFLANIANFVILFVVTKKIFKSSYAGLFVTLLYGTNYYLMGSRIPSNVTLMPGIAALIFFSITKVYEEKYRWIFVAWTLSGFFFNIHFTAIFLPPIILLSLLFVKDKKRAVVYSLLSLPLYFMWFIPNLIYELQSSHSDYYKMRNFLQSYYHGFHLRFMLHRLPESLIQFGAVMDYPAFSQFKYIIPSLFLVVVLFWGKQKDRLFAYLISLWFIIPLIGFTIYGGPVSDYYFLYSVPMVLFVLWYLQERLLKWNFRVILIISIVFWGLYMYDNTRYLWVKPNYGGLKAQKEAVKQQIHLKETIPYKDGDIESYLYTIWTKDNKRF